MLKVEYYIVGNNYMLNKMELFYTYISALNEELYRFGAENTNVKY